VNVAALWHDLECGAYAEDLPCWRAVAAETGGPVLDIGAGTGRVTLRLAAQGLRVVALDTEPELLAALAHRARGAAVETVVADARNFELERRFALIVVPMQTLQLLGGAAGRAAFLRCARGHLHPGGLVAAALADAMDCFDDEHELPPPPATREVAGVRYASQLFAVVDVDGRAALHRRRETGTCAEDVVVHLDRVSPDQVEAEAARCGFLVEPRRSVPESEQYLGSTIVVLRNPA
jgi:SAM-dependent methyltransferase